MTEEVKVDEKYLFLEKTEALVKQNEKLVEEMKVLVARNEDLAARRLLGGGTESGQAPIEKKEETPSEYAKRIMATQKP